MIRACNKSPAPRPPRRRGISLVETAVCVAVVGTVLAAGMGAIGTAARARLLQQERARAGALAAQLLGEIQQARYKDPDNDAGRLGPESGETARAKFNDVDDYAGWVEQPPAARDGTALAGCGGWKRQAAVQWVKVSDPAAVSAVETGLKKITVTVTPPSGRPVVLTALRFGDGAYDQIPSPQATYVGWVGVTCRIGTEPKTTAASGAPTANLVP